MGPMMILLNGPFGVGKTTTARLLAERLPGARVYDPERVGAVVRTLVRPFRPVPDYQDLLLWQRLAPTGARVFAALSGPLVIPMTLWRRDYCERFVARLRQEERHLLHVQMVASEDALRRRILARPDAEGSHAWCLAHLETGLAMAGDPAFGTPVETDGRAPVEVADAILALLEARRQGATQLTGRR